MNVLMTGASGFVGGYIYQEMVTLGHQVHTLGRASNSHILCELPAQVPVLSAPYQWVIHSLGLAHDTRQQQTPENFQLVNVIATQHLCKALESAPALPEAIVFISSVAVYGLQKGEAIQEDTALRGGNPYADSKIAAEQLLEHWCQLYQVPLVILRLPLVAGIHPPGNLGAMIQAIAANRYFNIDGGFARKSMVMAEDVAAVIPSVVKHPGIYHLTDDEHPTLAALAHVISRQMGKRDPMNISKCMALPAALCCGLLGKRAPITVEMLEKLTTSLTFSNQKIKDAVLWKPQPVTMALQIPALSLLTVE